MKFHETNDLGTQGRTRATRAYVHLDRVLNHLNPSRRPENTGRAGLVGMPRTGLKDTVAPKTSKLFERKARWESLALCSGKLAAHLTVLVVGNWLTWSWKIVKLRSKKECMLRKRLALAGLVPNGGISSKYLSALFRLNKDWVS